jgi:hypothetical protein
LTDVTAEEIGWVFFIERTAPRIAHAARIVTKLVFMNSSRSGIRTDPIAQISGK